MLSVSKIGLIVGFLMTFASPNAAQQSANGPPLSHTNSERAQMQDMSRREMQLRKYGNMAVEHRDQRGLKAIAEQVEEDFQRILIRHNEIARATSADNSLVYKFVSEATAEIQKRATRLRSRLVFYESAEGKQVESRGIESFDDAHVKDALISLCKRIRSFVTNPVIENPGTMDIKESARAGQDLERLIQLGGTIHKTAERLKKM